MMSTFTTPDNGDVLRERRAVTEDSDFICVSYTNAISIFRILHRDTCDYPAHHLLLAGLLLIAVSRLLFDPGVCKYLLTHILVPALKLHCRCRQFLPSNGVSGRMCVGTSRHGKSQGLPTCQLSWTWPIVFV